MSNASDALAPCAVGLVSGSMIFSCSMIDPGHPAAPETGRPGTAQVASPAGFVPMGTLRRPDWRTVRSDYGPAAPGAGWRPGGVPPARRAVPAPPAAAL